jgi:amino acid transporter
VRQTTQDERPEITMKKILFGMVWCVAFYFIACGVVGGVAGAKAGKNAGSATLGSQRGAVAGAKAVEENHVYIIYAAIALSVLGTALSILPGTRQRNEGF